MPRRSTASLYFWPRPSGHIPSRHEISGCAPQRARSFLTVLGLQGHGSVWLERSVSSVVGDRTGEKEEVLGLWTRPGGLQRKKQQVGGPRKHRSCRGIEDAAGSGSVSEASSPGQEPVHMGPVWEGVWNYVG